MRTLQALTVPLAALAFTAACNGPTTTRQQDASARQVATTAPQGTPHLVLLIVVDQMRGDYLQRFGDLFAKDGGFNKLLTDGVSFTNAHHFHAVTETAPGHATLATGMLPKSHGIVANYGWDWAEKEGNREVYSLRDPRHCQLPDLPQPKDERHCVSPHNLKVDTLGDKLKATYPGSKVFAVSGKDRAAILMGGHKADDAWWYHDKTGSWTTSTYYRDEEPAWVEEFNGLPRLEHYFTTVWRPLRPLDETSKHGVRPLDLGLGVPVTFPHALAGTSARDEEFFESIYESPFLDVDLKDFVKTLIEAEGLGTDAVPDLLAVSFSALDTVGHNYGPDAPETVDTLLRLDQTLGELLEFVDEKIGKENVVVALSADHGVARVPEVVVAEGGHGGRLTRCREALNSHLKKTFDRDDLLAETWAANTLYLSTAAIRKTAESRDRVEQEIIDAMNRCPLIHEVLRPADLKRSRGLRELYRHSYHEGRSPDLIVMAEPNVLPVGPSKIVADHGSPYRYDTHVPLIIRRPNDVGRVVPKRVNTIDLAPTLAAILGLASDGFDGVDRFSE